MTASSATVTNAVSCGTLTTDEIQLQMPGLSTNVMVNGAARMSFTQLKTQVLGDLEVTGNLTSANGGGTVDLSDYQKHASAHLQALGMESYYAANDVDFHLNPPWDHHLSWGNFTHVCNNAALHGNPNADATLAWVEFVIPANAKSCLVHMLTWSTGGYCDVELVASTGDRLFANRLQLYGPETNVTVDGIAEYSGRLVAVAAGHIDGPWSRIRFQGRKGAFNIISVAFQEEVLPQSSSFMHSDNIIGDPASLSDARLKSEITPVSGEQALGVLSQIRGCTYERDDLQQRRLGLIADEVEEAIEELAIDNVVGSKWHNGEALKTLDYSRLVALLIPAVNTLTARVQELEAKLKQWDSST